MASQLATLRALTFRIASIPPAHLPQHVPAIAAALASCRALLSTPQAAATKTASESSVAVHKYRTLLSTLLQDRTVQGRWSAVVLVKATIEVGGWEALHKSLPWVRGLLAILAKPDPPSSKKLCIIALTRIFVLTREFPTLVREITTPSLPAYIQSALQLANKAPASLVQIILESFNELLPRHPTVFRSYLKQLRPLLARLIAPTPSNKLGAEQLPASKPHCSAGVVRAAQRLYVQTSSCASKGASSEEWERDLNTTIKGAHHVADRVFRAVFEDWQASSRDIATDGHTLDDEVQDDGDNAMSLPPWCGLFAGSERLVQLLRLIQQYLANPTPAAVNISISAVIDLVTRLLSLTVPGSGAKAYQNTVKFNSQVSKEERDNLWLALPDIHLATIEILLVMADRFQLMTTTMDPLIVDHIVWVFASEKDFIQIRAACYRALAVLLQRSGITLPKTLVDSLVPLIRGCCDDLLPSDSASAAAKTLDTQSKTNGVSSSQVTANADTFLNASKSSIQTTSCFLGLHDAAHALLPVILSGVRAQYLSDALRSRLDRTATLTRHKDAMVASVLNPPSSKKFGKPAASIVPLMSRCFPASTHVEGILRPRMPVIRLGAKDDDMDENSEQEEEAVEEDAMEEEPMATEMDEELFMGNKPDTILQSERQTDTSAAVADSAATLAPQNSQAAADQQAPSPPRELRSALRSQHQTREPVKRVQIDAAPSFPSKRLKTDQDDKASSVIPSIPAPTVQISEVLCQPVIAPPTSDFADTSTESAVPELPEPGVPAIDASDSDGDDVVSLVLGQDTDEEDE
ncbi:hypothetical protein ACEQ8H_008009 [Pleosporales sp. CAS-2024a]